MAKRSKRCPVCKHILIKPEQKSSSTRYKIKLVAANYLPSVTIYRRPPASIGSRLSAIAAGTASGLRRTPRTATGRSTNDPSAAEDEPLRPGRTYTFELSLTNPLYEPIQVRLGVARPGANKIVEEGQTPPPPPFAVNLPSPSFPISAYAEDWEYEDDENAILREEAGDENEGGESGLGGSPKKKRRGGPGIVERRMNRTTVAMDVAIGRDVVGPLRVSSHSHLLPFSAHSAHLLPLHRPICSSPMFINLTKEALLPRRRRALRKVVSKRTRTSRLSPSGPSFLSVRFNLDLSNLEDRWQSVAPVAIDHQCSFLLNFQKSTRVTVKIPLSQIYHIQSNEETIPPNPLLPLRSDLPMSVSLFEG